jgi:hypothetical protein
VGQVIRLIYVTVNITTTTKSSLVYVAMGNNSCLLAPVLVPTGQEFDPSADKIFYLFSTCTAQVLPMIPILH